MNEALLLARCWQAAPMTQLMRFPTARAQDPAVQAWFDAPHDELRRLAQPWFERMRGCGPDVRELLHDGCPTACIEDAAFAYVSAHRGHINVGFYQGADLPDPAGLLQGSGKRMRHVKARWGEPVDAEALGGLIEAACRDMRARLADEA
jgi:hypothetical protein